MDPLEVKRRPNDASDSVSNGDLLIFILRRGSTAPGRTAGTITSLRPAAGVSLHNSLYHGNVEMLLTQ